jgi:hypothetical protein
MLPNIKEMSTEKNEKKRTFYSCNLCDYNTTKITDYERHLQTIKHFSNISSTTVNTKNEKKMFTCPNCDKEYKERTGLWKHKKICINTICDDENITDIETNVKGMLNDKDLMMALIKDNSDFKAMLMKVLENGTNNINNNNSNNTNSHNKTFNLQFFLNETCKNAMNIDEFVSSIQPTFEDLEHVGKVGYVEGISSIIIKKLNEVGVTERPFHCSDLKREVLYIKTNNAWIKETDEKPLLVQAIKQVAKQNMDNILPWQQAHPGCTKSDSIFNKKYLNMVMNSMDGSSDEEALKNINKLVSRLSNTVQLTNYK